LRAGKTNICMEFINQTEEIRGNNRWLWLKEGTIKRETESSLIGAAQEQAIRTNAIKAKIDKSQ